jgi:hypothetical protein
MQERRKEQRLPSYLGGRAVFADCYPATNCIIRNTSSLGARIEFATSGPLPPTFLLRIPKRNVELWVQTRWCGAGELGVEALSDRPTDIVDVELSRRLRQLNAHNDALKRRLGEMTESAT